MKATLKPKLSQKAFASVWDALESDPVVAANLAMRSELLRALYKRVGSWRLTQAEAARRLDITQPRLNDLLRGRISKFSLDALVNLAKRADITVQLKIRDAA